MGLLKKAKGFVKKTVRKVVPKELSGIMTAAAPFVAPASLPAAAALSIAGQLRTGQGRINPILTGASLLPGLKFDASRVGPAAFLPRGFTRFGQDAGASNLVGLRGLLFGGPGAGQSGRLGKFGDTAERFLFGREGIEGGNVFDTEGRLEGVFEGVKPTQGLLGFGGEFGTGGSLISTVKDGKPVINKAKVAGFIGAGLSLTQINNKIETEGADEGLTPSQLDDLKAEAADIFKDFDTDAFKPDVAEGGLMRTNYALGSKPTPKESGLGGLPIEADMRYTGGFMPYGAKEKADDVPARLSKNEFVFTADAVRAAGGGDINMGARRMYNTMKQLESMGRA